MHSAKKAIFFEMQDDDGKKIISGIFLFFPCVVKRKRKIPEMIQKGLR